MGDTVGAVLSNMEDEIRGYEYDPDRGFVFVSYAHTDRDRVYPVVLGWMRAGYNVYIDTDFERHGSDMHWVEQMGRALSRRSCRLAVCFRSIDYASSYAALIELLTMRSDTVFQRHSQEPLGVDVVALEPLPPDDESIPPERMEEYAGRFRRMRELSGKTFAGGNETERDALRDGFKEWLDGMDPAVRDQFRYGRMTAEKLMKNVDAAYEDGMNEFFPYISMLVKNWFISQNLNGNDLAPSTDFRARFERAGVELVREPVMREPVTCEPSAAPKNAAAKNAASEKPDDPAVLAMLRRSAEAGDMEAQLRLAERYFVVKNYAEAFRWYEKSAAQGHPTAMHNLGFQYEHGLGVKRDEMKALKLYTKAAEAGNPAAKYKRDRLHEKLEK